MQSCDSRNSLSSSASSPVTFTPYFFCLPTSTPDKDHTAKNLHMGKLPRPGTNKREKLSQSAARPASFPAHWHLPCPSVPWPIMHHHTWNPEVEPQVVLLLLKPHPWSCVPESSCSINFSLVTNHRLFDCKSICPSSQQQ